MKNIPNAITILRIILSLALLLLKPVNPVFWVIYSICGISDILDGFIARRLGWTSKPGAVLDSIADIVFIFAALVAILPTISIPEGIIIWVALIALVRVASLVAGYCKYHVFAALHTYSNKATGVLLFCSPYLLKFSDINLLACLVCAAASISAVEEFIILVTSKELSRNIKGIFDKL